MLMINLTNYFVLLVLILVNIAFITLLERKILGYSQLRLGPNKASFVGLTQPFSDAIKLFLKQNFFPINSNFYLYMISPSMAMIVTLTIWFVSPFSPSVIFSEMSILLFIMILSLGVYPLLLAGWSSNNKYGMVGGLRGVAQTISYEISLSLLMITLMLVGNSISFKMFLKNMSSMYVTIFMFLCLMIWILSMMAESNRTPFDFAEGESELVSGFNIEYMASGFALIFMAEYGMIYMLSNVTVNYFMNLSTFTFLHSMMTTLLVFFWVWVRTTYPRYRYDLLMNLAWKCLLPLTLAFMMMFLSMVMI